MGVYTGSITTVAAGAKLLASTIKTWTDALAALDTAFTAYTPAWTSSGTQPVLGNGTIVGKYSQVGKMVFFNITLTLGSTTTVGTGSYLLSLPVAALDTSWVAPIFFNDASAATNRIPGVAKPTNATLLVAFFPQSSAPFTTTGQWTATVPVAPATSDVFIVTGQYEAA